MKRKLLYLASIVLFSASVNAQTTWNFSTAATTVGTVSTTNGATIYADPANTGADSKKWGPTYGDDGTTGNTPTPTPATIKATGFPGLEFAYKNTNNANFNIQFLNGTAPNGYFQANGKDVVISITGCTAGQNIAVQYSAKSNTTACPATAFLGTSGTSSSVVTAFPPNCTLINTTTTSANTSDIQVINFTVTANGTVNLLTGSPGFRLYQIVKGGTLGVNDVISSESPVTVVASEGKINVSGVASATKVSVYSILGSLVKSAEVSADASLDINKGLYIVKAQSAEGTKTVKVLVK